MPRSLVPMQPTSSNPHRSSNQSSAWPGSCALLTALLGSLTPGVAQDQLFQPAQLKKEISTNAPSSNSLTEELRWLKAERVLITTVSKRPEDPFAASAAVSVISGEDIVRSGARTLPDALRLAPGISVAQVDASKWAVASRGLNDIFTNRLLVLVDGRTVYSPGFAGVFWAAQDVLLEDVDHIEVVRGPGGTLWGANAVNGVINIITKDTQKSQGTYFNTGGGTQERFFGEARHEGHITDDLTGRIYFKYADRGEHPTGTDRWDSTQGGMRLDWHLPDTQFTLRGDLFDVNTRDTFLRPTAVPPFFTAEQQAIDYSGGNALFRAEHDFSTDSQLHFQTYFSSFREHRFDVQTEELVDVELQHSVGLTDWWKLIYGANYRYLPTDSRSNNYFTYSPTMRKQQIFSGFAQTDFLFFAERLKLTLGSKLEANDITGLETQPNVRVSWNPDEKHSLWAAFSKAVQIPSRANTDLTVPQFGPVGTAFGLPVMASFSGSPNLGAQELTAYEVGYRVRPREDVTLDAAAFYNVYEKGFGSVTGVPGFVPFPAPHLLLPVTSDNSADFNSFGTELSADWLASEWCRLTASYSYIKLELDRGTPLDQLGSTPQQQVGLRSAFNLPNNWTLDLGVRYVDRITANSVTIPSYTTMDARLAWQPHLNWEVALVGRNLFAHQHFEYSTPAVNPTQATPVPREVFLQLTARF
ncbi:MAG: TonB-dependent receptor [Verrucomicrobia bacterium]|nr:TonB-dependent receptor [Verrucomicrobiota bacterium]